MGSCCNAADSPTPVVKGTLTIALAGNPNCGKTTIFNGLTGMRQRVANYPGVTVEKKTGKLTLPDGRGATLIDLPGTYSLVSRSPDEVVAMEVLRGLRPDTPAPDVVIVAVDASNLQRNLYLVSQLIELGRPLVVALNMMDIARRRGIDVSIELLEKELGVPVVAVVAHKREGLDELKAAVARARVAPMPDWPLPLAFKEELATVGGALAILDHEPETGKAFFPSVKPFIRESEDSTPCGSDGQSIAASSNGVHHGRQRVRNYQMLAERLLVGDTAPDLLDIAAREPVKSVLNSAQSRLRLLGVDPMQVDIETHYRWIENVVAKVSSSVDELAAMGNPAPGGTPDFETPRRRYLSERLDSVFVHKIWGMVIFALVMGTLFVTIFWLAKPIMEGISDGIKALGLLTTKSLGDGPIKDLLRDGVFAGVGAVVVFVPQIAILFFFLAVLEDSGYLARAAFLMDRVLAKVGLHGKSFIPLLSSFACAIPGIMATRTIEDRKSRLATILIAPFMSCSARLPVYTLLIATFFAAAGPLKQAGIMLALYALGILAAAATAWCFKRTLLRGPTPAFILELPSYKLPQASQVTRHVLTNTWEFLAKAGTTIFFLSVVLWAMTYYPQLPGKRQQEIKATVTPTVQMVADAVNPPPQTTDQVAQRPAPEVRDGLASLVRADGSVVVVRAETGEVVKGAFSAEEKARLEESQENEADKIIGAETIRNSVAGRIGRTIEPVIKPLGYDWKIGVGLIGAFAAREVFVSTIGIIYSVGDVGDETTDLKAAMLADKTPSGQLVWSTPVALSLLVWFVLAMQCMSTLAIVRRETGGWRWSAFMLLYMNALAYVVSLGVYQLSRMLA